MTEIANRNVNSMRLIDGGAPLSVYVGRADAAKKLLPHQRAALHRCLEIEAGAWRDLPAPHVAMRSSLACYCDAPGSGKSMVVLALADHACNAPSGTVTRSFSGGRVTLESGVASGTRDVQIDVVVAPHNVTHQWTAYAQDAGMSDVFRRVVNKADIARAQTAGIDAFLRGARVVLVSTSTLAAFRGLMEAASLRCRRLVFDEADTVHTGRALVPARMVWLVTGSVRALLNPLPNAAWLNGRMHFSKGVHSQPLRSLVYDLIHLPMWPELVVRCDEDFLRASFPAARVQRRFLLCFTPASSRLLSGFVGRDIMQALHMDDLETALRCVDNKGEEEDIVRLITDRWTRTAEDLERKLDTFGNDVEAADIRALLQSRLDTCRSNLEGVRARVRDSEACCICYCELRHKTVLPCCSSSYCLECLATWMQRGGEPTCPMCRAPFTERDMHVVVNGGTASAAADGAGPVRSLCKRETSFRLVERLLEQPGRRVLFSCTSALVLAQLRSAWSSRFGIGVLKGNNATIRNAVRRFEHGHDRLLFVSADNYCAGINLSFATDVVLYSRCDASVEEQLIGRALRLGRTAPLNVWYMVQSTEPGGEQAVPWDGADSSFFSGMDDAQLTVSAST